MIHADGWIKWVRKPSSLLNGKRRLREDRCNSGIGRAARVQYAYIEQPKTDQTSLHQPKAPVT
jgi:hypothetical protein